VSEQPGVESVTSVANWYCGLHISTQRTEVLTDGNGTPAKFDGNHKRYVHNTFNAWDMFMHLVLRAGPEMC